MDLFTAVFNRASYRGPFRSDPVPREHLTRILEAGAAAPSGCNAQTASFIAVDDAALLKEISGLIGKPGYASAPAAICVLTRPIPVYAGNIYNVQDYAAAIENMLLAITALGYASCWVEGYVTMGDIGARIASALSVPEEYALVCYLPVGVPTKAPSRPEKLPLARRAWFNRFGAGED